MVKIQTGSNQTRVTHPSKLPRPRNAANYSNACKNYRGFNDAPRQYPEADWADSKKLIDVEQIRTTGNTSRARNGG